MYEEFFGLAERPFELTPNPRYLYLFPQHREALATLKYGISTARGLTLLLGEAGTGKTTLLRAALHDAAQGDLLCVSLGNPTLTRSEFVHFLADEFSLSRDAAASKVVLLRELKVLLEDRRARGATTVLLIDEAQSLPDELLEEVRLLANLETDTEKLLPVVLAGQPELARPAERAVAEAAEATRCDPMHGHTAPHRRRRGIRGGPSEQGGWNGLEDIHAGGDSTDIQPFKRNPEDDQRHMR